MFDHIFLNGGNNSDSHEFERVCAVIGGDRSLANRFKKYYSDVTHYEKNEKIDLSKSTTLIFVLDKINDSKLTHEIDDIVDKYAHVDGVASVVVIGSSDSLNLMAYAKSLGVIYATFSTCDVIIKDSVSGGQKLLQRHGDGVLIIGAAGGVGASTVSFNILKNMEKGKGKVLAFDSHTNPPMLRYLLGANNHPLLDMNSISSLGDLDLNLIQVSDKSFSLIHAHALRQNELEELNRYAFSNFKYIVMDGSKEILSYNILNEYNCCLIVVNSTLASFIGLGYILQKIADLDFSNVKVVYNNSHDKAQTITLSDYKKNYNSVIFYELPHVMNSAANAIKYLESYSLNKDYVKCLSVLCDDVFPSNEFKKNNIKKPRSRSIFSFLRSHFLNED